jgi:phosphatidylglycerophosphatase C
MEKKNFIVSRQAVQQIFAKGYTQFSAGLFQTYKSITTMPAGLTPGLSVRGRRSIFARTTDRNLRQKWSADDCHTSAFRPFILNRGKQCLALFDFDHTITYRNSFLEFMKYTFSAPALLKGVFKLTPVIASYFLKRISNYRAKEKAVSLFFKGWSELEFNTKARGFYETILTNIVKQSALERIKWHLDQNHKVYVVSASIENWIRDFCLNLGIGLIATKLKIEDGHITGRFLTPNCYGEEKVKRIKEEIDLSAFNYIYAYGDSKGDKQMLELAGEPYYRSFN